MVNESIARKEISREVIDGIETVKYEYKKLEGYTINI